MSDELTAGTVRFAGHQGEEIEGYLATPGGATPRGAVVVIHHLPGYDRASKEITRRFTDIGYTAVCPNLYSRTGLDPEAAGKWAWERGGIEDDQLVGDVAGAAAQLRSLPTSNGNVGVIGFCSGGRQAVLAACNVDLDAAVDCYGGGLIGPPPQGLSLKARAIPEQLPNLRCPLLGLFGNEDRYPDPARVDELDAILTEHNKRHEFHRYDNAGHGFFAVDRPMYRVEAANDGWAQIAEFFGRCLG